MESKKTDTKELSKIENFINSNMVRIITIVVTVAITAIFNNVEVRNYKALTDRQLVEISELKDNIRDYSIEIERLKKNSMLANSVTDYLPYPTWIKDSSLRMVDLNKSYEDLILKPINKSEIDYIGLTNEEFWGDVVGKQYSKNDLYVLRTGNLVSIEETTVIKGDTLNVTTTKFPLKINNNILGVGGISIIDFNE